MNATRAIAAEVGGQKAWRTTSNTAAHRRGRWPAASARAPASCSTIPMSVARSSRRIITGKDATSRSIQTLIAAASDSAAIHAAGTTVARARPIAGHRRGRSAARASRSIAVNIGVVNSRGVCTMRQQRQRRRPAGGSRASARRRGGRPPSGASGDGRRSTDRATGRSSSTAQGVRRGAAARDPIATGPAPATRPG